MRTDILRRAVLSLASGAAALACGADAVTDPPPEAPSPRVRLSIAAASSTRQDGWIDSTVDALPTVLVTDQLGRPAGGVFVTFRVLSGGGSVDTPSARTDGNGTAGTSWTLGPARGEQVVAAVLPTSEAVLFIAVADSLIVLPPTILSDWVFGETLQVFRRESDGTRRQLTSELYRDADAPTVSPDGSRIAFIRDRQIHLMNADGSGITPLQFEAAGRFPIYLWPGRLAWSPDGTRLAFPDPLTRGISIIGIDGTGLQQLTTPGRGDLDADASWSRDGTQIAFTRWIEMDYGEVWVADVDGGGESRVGPAGGTSSSGTVSSCCPVWSPDHHIAFAGTAGYGEYAIFAARRDGSEVVELERFRGAQGMPMPTDWSGDGRWIAIVSLSGDWPVDVWYEAELLGMNGIRRPIGTTSRSGARFLPWADASSLRPSGCSRVQP